MENIKYDSQLLAQFFANHRIRWEDFYESERKLFSLLPFSKQSRVLDIGCGCGGLGLALNTQFGVESYLGVDINQATINEAKKINPHMNLMIGDILELSKGELGKRKFDMVVSLSCIDWNVRFKDMLNTAWELVEEGGYFVSTFRLSLQSSVLDMNSSYQYINFEDKLEGEKAAYVVLNVSELFETLLTLNPTEIIANGYWGVPSVTAVTPYKSLCFSAFAIKKLSKSDSNLVLNLDFPHNVLSQLLLLPK